MLDVAVIRFRRSLYLSLALACACLTYAEWLFLPKIVVLSLAVGVSLWISYRREDRWELSLGAANLVGAVIVVAAAAWIAYEVFNPGKTMRYLSWPTWMLPFLGPLVLVVIPAKLFRPKHLGDYWSLQLIGLMGVALACALASDGTVAVLAAVYALAGVRCLVDFHAYVTASGTQTSAARAAGWVAASAVVAIAASLATPRMTDARWEYGQIASRLRSGINEDHPAIDLNQSGELKLSSDEAFTVSATTADGSPKLDLPPTQRWRGVTFNYYDRGHWTNRPWVPMLEGGRGKLQAAGDRGPAIGGRLSPADPTIGLPNLGPNRFYLTFRYPTKPQGIFYLADPIRFATSMKDSIPLAPVRTETEGGESTYWFVRGDGDLQSALLAGPAENAVYRQVMLPVSPNEAVGPVIRVDLGMAMHLTSLTGLPELRRFGASHLQELISTKQIPWNGEPPGPTHPVPPELHEAVARAFEHYLRDSGKFQYSYTLEPTTSELDPVEDFLLNQRSGHCNRFSTALALLLRSVGISSRIVLGYMGAESQGNGNYTVRQSHAHSWVECLVHRKQADGKLSWHWMTLDPTPGIDADMAATTALGRWWDALCRNGGNVIQSFLIDLTPERQQSLQAELASIEFNGPTIAVVASPFAVAGCLVFWKNAKAIRKARPQLPYEQLVELVKRRHLLAASVSWTPNEFHSRCASFIRDSDAIAAVRRIVAEHNRHRYGGHGAVDQCAARADLAALRRGLARR